MKLFVVVLCVALLVCFASVSFAADNGMNGKNEIQAAAAWAQLNADGGDITATAFAVNYGKFVTPNIEAKLEAVYANADISDGGGNAHAWLLAPAVSYHFFMKNDSAIVPYAGLGLAYVSAKASGAGSTSSTKLEEFVGAKFFIGGNYKTSDKAVFVEYRHVDFDFNGADFGLNTVWGGISVFF